MKNINILAILLAVLIPLFSFIACANVKVSDGAGNWKDVPAAQNISVSDGATWHSGTQVYVSDGSAWHPVYAASATTYNYRFNLVYLNNPFPNTSYTGVYTGNSAIAWTYNMDTPSPPSSVTSGQFSIQVFVDTVVSGTIISSADKTSEFSFQPAFVRGDPNTAADLYIQQVHGQIALQNQAYSSASADMFVYQVTIKPNPAGAYPSIFTQATVELGFLFSQNGNWNDTIVTQPNGAFVVTP